MFSSLDGERSHGGEQVAYVTMHTHTHAHGDTDIDTDAAMVELARTGDMRGFAGLFQCYNAPVCSYLARMVGNDEVGRDLSQETFLRAWKSLPDLQGELYFKAWLYSIATNVARSYLRHERLIRWLPWMEHEEQQRGMMGNSGGAEEDISRAEGVTQALAQLAPQCRACLLLQLVSGFSQREVALLLGISEKSVSAYVSRGREQFRRAYRRLQEQEEAEA
jgi:RNA polymerase sigma-70 factor (ECF subfamily)